VNRILKGELTKNDELLAEIQISEGKKFYDRANFFIAAEGIFFNAFITAIVGFTKLEGLLAFAPIVICAIGILLNTIYVISSYIQIKILVNIGQTLNARLDKLSAENAGNADFSLGLYRSEFSPKSGIAKPAGTKSQPGEQPNDEPKGLVALVYKWAPAILFVGWFIMLAIYSLQLAGVKLF
jgi:hypothetical protein